MSENQGTSSESQETKADAGTATDALQSFTQDQVNAILAEEKRKTRLFQHTRGPCRVKVHGVRLSSGVPTHVGASQLDRSLFGCVV